MSFKKKEISDDSPALADDSDGPVAAPAASDSGRSGPAISKRAFLKGAATAPFAAAGAKYSIGRSRAIAPAVGVAIGAGAAAGYLMRSVQDYATGSPLSSDKYAELSGEEIHAQVRQDAIEIRETDNTVLTTVNNLLNNAQNAAFSKAKYAAIESMNIGDSESTVKTKAEDVINAYYSVQAENVLKHFSIQATKVYNSGSQVDNVSDPGDGEVFKFRLGSDVYNTTNGGPRIESTKTYTLPDGSDVQYTTVEVTREPTQTNAFKPTGTPDNGSQRQLDVKPLPETTDSTIEMFSDNEYRRAIDKIETQSSNVVSEINTWITGVYSNYNSGDIALSDMVSASDIANKAPNEQGFSYAGADLALLGIEGADHAYSIELMESGQVVQGTIYAQGRTKPLELGTVYSPDSIAGTVWLAYETTDDSGNTVSDLVGLEQNFQVLDGKDSEGNSVSEVSFSSKNQQTTDTDVQKIQEELQQLQELQNELEKQQQQEVSSGGGGFVDSFAIGDLPGAATIAIIGGGILVLFGQDDN